MRPVRFASIRIESDRHLDDLFCAEAAPDNHLGGKLHPDALLLEVFEQLLREPAKSAVSIIDRSVKHFPDEKRKCRIAQPTMQERHRSGFYSPLSRWKTTTLNQIIAFPQLI